MDGFWSSFSKWFNEKTSSPLYFTYIGFLIVWDWKFFQIIFLESASLFSQPKVEYISAQLNFHVPTVFWFSPWINALTTSIPINWLVNSIWHLGPPAFFTWAAIEYLPPIQKWALEKHLDSLFERKLIYANKQIAYDALFLKKEKEHNKTLKDIVTIKQEQEETKKEIKRSFTNEELWALEYDEFRKTPQYYKFRELLTAIYSHGGSITDSFGNQNVDVGAIAAADTRGLIAFSPQNRDTISLTEKGKYIGKLYLNQNPI